jgi:hypothetical protein
MVLARRTYFRSAERRKDAFVIDWGPNPVGSQAATKLFEGVLRLLVPFGVMGRRVKGF